MSWHAWKSFCWLKVLWSSERKTKQPCSFSLQSHHCNPSDHNCNDQARKQTNPEETKLPYYCQRGHLFHRRFKRNWTTSTSRALRKLPQRESFVYYLTTTFYEDISTDWEEQCRFCRSQLENRENILFECEEIQVMEEAHMYSMENLLEPYWNIGKWCDQSLALTLQNWSNTIIPVTFCERSDLKKIRKWNFNQKEDNFLGRWAKPIA
jgi:hypothetical protein